MNNTVDLMSEATSAKFVANIDDLFLDTEVLEREGGRGGRDGLMKRRPREEEKK